MFKNRRGFTIIELLVVVSIISTLGSVVLTATNSARAQGRDSVRISQLRQVQLAVELYYSNNGFYPTMRSTDIVQNWLNLMTTLEAGKYVAKAQEIIDQKYPHERPTLAAKLGGWIDSLSITKANAAASAHLQDPQYPDKSYGYMPGAVPVPYQNFRLRAQLEDTNNPVLKKSISGMFLWSDEDPISYPEGFAEECAPLQGYYCIGPQLNEAEGFVAFDPGKPVVYLYPEHIMPISVAIAPKGIDESTPEYGTGWNVIGNPSGDIINPADGKTYPYLYWEGKSEEPVVDRTKGFVVKTSELGTFLADALAKQGLNKKESAEFMEYWIPVMTRDLPYTYVYFMPQADYERIVPMTVTPAPDTTIRVYMLYKPLPEPVAVTPQKLTAPERKGFTVVEWGGNRSFLK